VINLKVLAVILMIGNAMAQQALGGVVDGFELSPLAKFVLSEFSTGVGVALFFLPRPSEDRDPKIVEHG
jgi:ABC-type Mn2+/Zn2+ transport system permease subunit